MLRGGLRCSDATRNSFAHTAIDTMKALQKEAVIHLHVPALESPGRSLAGAFEDTPASERSGDLCIRIK